jgi:hypothetical protein
MKAAPHGPLFLRPYFYGSAHMSFTGIARLLAFVEQKKHNERNDHH